MCCTQVSGRVDLSDSDESDAGDHAELLPTSRSVLDGVVAAAAAGRTAWADIMQPLADDETETRAESAALEFLQHVSPHKALRDASTEADKLISEFGVSARCVWSFTGRSRPSRRRRRGRA